MKRKILTVVHGGLCCLLTALLLCCKERATDKLPFRFNATQIQARVYHFGSDLQLEMTAKKQPFDSIALQINGRKTKGDSIVRLDRTLAHYGINSLKASVFYGRGKVYKRNMTFTLLPKRAPAQWSYRIVKRFPHDTSYFTEGLTFQGGLVYESTGGYGASKLVRYALGSHKPDRLHELDKKYFGEGIALLGDTLYQLTYKSRKVLLYDARTFTPKGVLPYPPSLSEGWGLYYHKPYLLLSDGSPNIYFLDGALNVKRRIQVTTDKGLVDKINELEVFRGKLYANVWQKPVILVIDVDTGVVEAEIDLKALVQKYGKYGVLNGIAVRAGHLLLTGKNWDTIFEVAIRN